MSSGARALIRNSIQWRSVSSTRTAVFYSRRDRVAVVMVLLLGGAVIPILITRHYGALNVPRSDAWSYLETLFTWTRTGRWSFNDWGSMTLLGHIMVAAPVVAVFGERIAAIDVFVAIVGVAGLMGVVGVGRRLGLSSWHALLAALTLAASPLWGPLATTYMTDVPAFAVQTLALWAAARAFARRPASTPWLVASVALGVLAFAIRQYAVVTLLAVLVAALVGGSTRDHHRARPAAVALTAAATVVSLALLVWWSRVPDRLVLYPKVPNSASIRRALASAGGYLRLAGVVTVPVLALVDPVALARRAWRRDRGLTMVVATIAATGLVGSYLLDAAAPFVGNYFDRRGTLGDDIIRGRRPLVMPSGLFDLLVVVGSLAAIVLLVATVPWLAEQRDRWRDGRLAVGDPVVLAIGLSVVGAAVALEAAILLRLPIFDRYALPVLPLVALLVLRSECAKSAEPVVTSAVAAAGRRAVARSLVALGVLGALGAVYTGESASFDAARWQLATAVVAQGWSAADIEAGYEWGGFVRGVAPPYLPADTPAIRLTKKRRFLRGTCIGIVVNPPGRPRRALAEARAVGWLRPDVLLFAVPTDRPCASGRPAPP